MSKKNVFTAAGLLTVAIFMSSISLTKHQEPFDIVDYTWLTGTWTGDGFGGISEETWSAPSPDGTMMGMYRHMNKKGEVSFYEFFLLDKEGIRLKHFSPDLVAWEDKEDHVMFEMLKYSLNRIEMKGLTYERTSPSEMEIRLSLKRKDGTFETETFKMKKE